MTSQLVLPWGDEKISLSLPDTWRTAGVMIPNSREGLSDLVTEIARAMAEPIGMDRLQSLITPQTRIALVIDDDSRPTPVGLIMPAVVDEIVRAGGGLAQVTLVAALGLHRAMTNEELARRVGPDYFAEMKVATHDCDDPGGLITLGVTSYGTPVLVNRAVAESDLIISIGCIEPHIIASFGGGYKNLFPGVAGRATIGHNHTLNCTPETFNSVGQPIFANPMRQDLEECGKMLHKPVFIINAVLNSALEVVQVVAGHPIAAHRAGTETSTDIYGVRIPKIADVVISDSSPMDQDLRQGVKALANTIRAVRKGGAHITLIRAAEGVGVFGLANRKLPLGRSALRLLAPILLPLIPRLNIKGMGEEDRFFLYFAVQAMVHATLIAYAPTIPAEVKANLPFITFVDSVEDAIMLAKAKVGDRAEVLVFPHGGSTYPILP